MRFLVLGLWGVVLGCGPDRFTGGDAALPDGAQADQQSPADTGADVRVDAMSGPCAFPTPPDTIFCADFETVSTPGMTWSSVDSTGGCTQLLEAPMPAPPIGGPKVFTSQVSTTSGTRCNLVYEVNGVMSEPMLQFLVYQFHTTAGEIAFIGQIGYENYNLALGVNGNGQLMIVESGGALPTGSVTTGLSANLGGGTWHSVRLKVALGSSNIGVNVDGNDKYNGAPATTVNQGLGPKTHFIIGNQVSMGPFVHKFDAVVVFGKM